MRAIYQITHQYLLKIISVQELRFKPWVSALANIKYWQFRTYCCFLLPKNFCQFVQNITCYTILLQLIRKSRYHTFLKIHKKKKTFLLESHQQMIVVINSFSLRKNFFLKVFNLYRSKETYIFMLKQTLSSSLSYIFMLRQTLSSSQH